MVAGYPNHHDCWCGLTTVKAGSVSPCLVHDLFLLPEHSISLQNGPKKLESVQLSKSPPGVSSAWLVALGRALACVLLWIRRAFLFLRRLRQFSLTGAFRWRIRHAYGERLPTVQHSEMPFYCWPWNLWLNMHGACTCDLGSIAYCLPEARESGKTRKKRRLGKTGNLIGIS